MLELDVHQVKKGVICRDQDLKSSSFSEIAGVCQRHLPYATTTKEKIIQIHINIKQYTTGLKPLFTYSNTHWNI